MADALLATSLDLANHTGASWSKNIRGGVLAKLAPEDPQLKVGSTDHFTFTGTPKAELVGEGQNKSSADGKPVKKTSKTYTVQLTYRFSNQLMWEDEDYQTGIVEKLVENVAKGLSRALDLIAIHGINPATGQVATQVSDYLTKSGEGVNIVTETNNAFDDIQAAAADLQANGYVATGIAFDPAYAGILARTKNTMGNPLFPELGLGFNFDQFQGLQAGASDTVSARQELGAAGNKVRAIMGDFNAFQWGVARMVPLETIQYGDPDGNGDLKRTNEIAIRAEAVIGFAIFDGSAFSVIESAVASS